MELEKMDILLVDDEPIIHESVGRYMKKCGHRVLGAKDGFEALTAAVERPFDLALLDVRMPRMDGFQLLAKLSQDCPDLPCVIVTAHADVDMAVRALREGAADFLMKPVELLELDAVLARVARFSALKRENRQLRGAIRGMRSAEQLQGVGARFLGTSRAARGVREQIALAIEAKCDTVLVTGETGVGKEIVARELHDRSARSEYPFIPVNCPAIPESMVEGELFGHTKGAFTGAAQAREGYFEMANGGTIFLDEIADLTASAQAAILRVVEMRRVRRVGGGDEIDLDLCLVVASNQNLQKRVRESRFRQDLYYRLNLFVIDVPPLRERREDIPALTDHFLGQFTSGRMLPARDFSAEARSVLFHYDYPGNVRELKNLVERSIMICRAALITPDLLAFAPAAPELAESADSGGDERSRIVAALQRSRWNRRKAAEDLGMGYSTLREKIARYAIH